MSSSPAASHWDGLYRRKTERELSWYTPHLETSLSLIASAGIARTATIVDIGGGASTLAEDLAREGYARVIVLDLSAAALARARDRFAASRSSSAWVVGDATRVPLADHSIDLWHDRAAFHFLTGERGQQAYVGELRRTVKPGGCAIIATFGPGGPDRCSGLPVVRYSAETLHRALGPGFALVEAREELHRTPGGAAQEFVYVCSRRRRHA